MIFTQFVLMLAIAVVAALGALLATRWNPGASDAVRNAASPLAVAILAVALVALAFVVV